ncbi:MAG: copper resistance D family protein [Actinomycetota bacterium]
MPGIEGGFEETFRGIAFLVARFTTFTAHAFIFGLVPFLFFVLRPSFAGVGEAGWSEGRARLSRRLEDLVQAALVGSAIATIVSLLLQATLIAEGTGGDVGSDTFSAIASTPFGQWHLLRFPLLLGLAVLLVRHVEKSALAGAGDDRRSPTMTWWAAWSGLATGLLLTNSMSGHAFVATPQVVSIPNDVIHLASGSTWLTGIVLMAMVLPSAWRGKDDDDRVRMLTPVVIRFSKLAAISIAIIAITGTINSFLDIGKLSDMIDTRYGRSLTIKIGAFLFVLALGGVNHFYVRHKLETNDRARSSAHLFRRTIAIELALGVAIIGVTAVLTGQARTREATDPASSVTSAPRT